jgi:small subunit ribosomal protein S28e
LADLTCGVIKYSKFIIKNEIILIQYFNHHMESEPVKARVTQLLGRTGSRGGITQVKVILITGKEADKRHLIRNVKGPVRVGDVLELMES